MQEKIAMPSDEQSWAEGSQFSIPVDEQISKWCQLTKTCFMISDGWMSLYPPRCGSLRGWQFQTYSDHQATASTFVPVLILWLTSNWPFASSVVTMIFHCRSNRDVWNLRSSESQHSTPIPSWTNLKKHAVTPFLSFPPKLRWLAGGPWMKMCISNGIWRTSAYFHFKDHESYSDVLLFFQTGDRATRSSFYPGRTHVDG